MAKSDSEVMKCFLLLNATTYLTNTVLPFDEGNRSERSSIMKDLMSRAVSFEISKKGLFV